MAEYKILIEGQTIPVPPEIGESDENVKKALAPFFPEAANAMITRTEKDGVISVNVVKKAGSKGEGPLQRLLECPESRNPAVKLHQELTQRFPAGLDAEAMLELDQRIDKAIESGEQQGRQIEGTLQRLQKSRPVPAPVVVAGF